MEGWLQVLGIPSGGTQELGSGAREQGSLKKLSQGEGAGLGKFRWWDWQDLRVREGKRGGQCPDSRPVLGASGQRRE